MAVRSVADPLIRNASVWRSINFSKCSIDCWRSSRLDPLISSQRKSPSALGMSTMLFGPISSGADLARPSGPVTDGTPFRTPTGSAHRCSSSSWSLPLRYQARLSSARHSSISIPRPKPCPMPPGYQITGGALRG